jgi:hypothetical protein
MSRIGHVKAFSSAAIRHRKEVRTPKRPGTAAGNPGATSHERLAVQERRRRLSAHTGAGGGGGLAGERRGARLVPRHQCIATAPLRGRRSHTGTAGLPLITGRSHSAADRHTDACPALAARMPGGRGAILLLRRTVDSAELVAGRTLPMRRDEPRAYHRHQAQTSRRQVRGHLFHRTGETILSRRQISPNTANAASRRT